MHDTWRTSRAHTPQVDVRYTRQYVGVRLYRGGKEGSREFKLVRETRDLFILFEFIPS